jgi:cobalt/nickel transport system permease protein
MHIPDGFLGLPVLVGTGAASLGCLTAGVVRARKTLGEQQVPLLGVTAAFIFAAQMVNFPVAGGTSGHFVGAAMAAILLGPLNAVLALTVVLVIQALVFFDGGLTALGANVFNMGVTGALVGWATYVLLLRVLPKGRAGLLGAAGVASWVAVVAAAGMAALELGLSGTVPLHVALPAMLGVHALIGVGEALVTMAVVATVSVARPDLLVASRPVESEGAG